jgi:hypothetical protein
MTFPLILALTLNGMLAGMTVDQSVKQLPARKKIGAAAFSRYSRAADLQNGAPLYAFFGLGAPASCVWLAMVTLRQLGWHAPASIAALAGILFSLGQLAITAFAAPTDFSQRRHALSEEAALARIFDRFAAMQTYRTICILLAFASVLWIEASDGL